MIFLLDTNTCIYLIKKKPLEVLQKFNTYVIDDVGVSSSTVAELQFGAQKSQRPAQNQQALEQFLLPLTIMEFDYGAAVVYGRIRAVLETQGTPIGSLDMLIAAHAVSLNVTLVTNNTREFARVPNLKIENWVNG